MEYPSFAKALEACLNAEEGSEEQEAALVYCLEHAPPELKEMLGERMAAAREKKAAEHGDCGCGCKK